MNDLFRIHTFYKFSLESFLVVVERAILMVKEGKLVFDLPDKKETEEEEEGEEKKEGEVAGEKKEGEVAGEEKKEGEGEGDEKKEEVVAEDGEGEEKAAEGEGEAEDEKLLEVSPRALKKRVEAITESLNF